MSVATSELHQPPVLTIELEWRGELEARVADLCAVLSTYLEAEQVDKVRQACFFAAEAHATQRRKSGEPYVFHPIAVACILAESRFDHETLMAAVLHDVIEDTPFDKEQLSDRFGAEVTELVDGVTKLTQINFSSRLEAQAENFRKMFLAMARDIRVIIIKLADRLHNMRTLDAMESEKRRRIARETLEIYAPIAARLGMNQLRLELENLGFSYLYPYRYRVLSEAVRKLSGHRKEVIQQLETRIRNRLLEEDIKAKVLGRSKHPWGIYRKMRDKGIAFKDIHDVYAARIIVDTVDTCYRVLGVIHGLYKPIMGRFKDYVAIPKANGYQSLHTVLFGPNGIPIEAQIRSTEMHLMAEAGIAAHWLYKAPGSQGNNAQKRARQWLQKLLDMQRRAGNSVEFLDSVKMDLFPDEVYVFTPRGEIIELPRGATAVDFAYAIHSDVGNTCVGAKTDRRLIPLRTPLTTGQTVEIIITPTARPNPAWLSFVVTAKARASIRHYLKHLQREEAVILGKRLLEKALLGHFGGLNEISPERLDALCQELNIPQFDDILADIGLGNRLAPLIARRLLPEGEEQVLERRRENSKPLFIKGTEGTVISFGKCCRPLPGDPIMGYLSAGRGIVIHRVTCRNVADYKHNPEKWIEVEWEGEISNDFPVELRLDMTNKRGTLAAISAAISAADANIENINTLEKDGITTNVNLMLSLRDRSHLAQVIRRLRTLPEVLRISRR
ncbi:MAG: bifunctional GTP diphosphokinase/guanosine-3',5'-bis pyrophosphate 3'-pyrophosphohydrolase [Candidatus Competibacteraceae bacterium]|jgi:RelA/SpoT family (p)ppGpp synthetase|nr:bifunctional GTP diphosphokinase/guanosine-3',5'-bis pyrophosphate 3'-pyrophosphohydrolase [Candidatus Competibacteraceae bacterium]